MGSTSLPIYDLAVFAYGIATYIAIIVLTTTTRISIAYSSSGGNGWLGVGWDFSTSRIEIDTRFGEGHCGRLTSGSANT